jgi:DNA-binding winged helix-turn-helix (wHTH) protein
MATAEQQFISFGPFRLDQIGRTLVRGGTQIALGARAFDVLSLLAEAGGEAVAKETLLQRAWCGLTVDENIFRSRFPRCGGCSETALSQLSPVVDIG